MMWQMEKSELGVIYLSEHNEEVLTKLIKKNGLIFEELFTAEPHVFISNVHPLAVKAKIQLEDLKAYPYLTYEAGGAEFFLLCRRVFKHAGHA